MNISIFFDFETTGLSRQWSSIIEVAAIAIDTDTWETVDSFHEYIKPREKIPAMITELTGITNEQVAYCRCEKDVLLDFVEWVAVQNAAHIIGHNCSSFDLQFLAAKDDMYKLSWASVLENMSVVDTLKLARQLKKQGVLPLDHLKQTDLAEFYGIDYEAHSALEDVKALVQIYQRMAEDKKPSREELGF